MIGTSVKAERDRFIGEWALGLRPREVPVLILPVRDMWDNNVCADRESMLRWNLWGMMTSAEWASDAVFAHIEPWYGVGVYASAFGSRYWWDGNSAPQTRPIYASVDDVANATMPDPRKCKTMQEVMTRILWYREVTHHLPPICLTDTQSPNDTASLLMESNEFFVACLEKPERLAPLLNAITDLVIAFSEMQMKAIGPNLALPGHQMLCHPSWSGISVSDDNMALLSPKAYELASLPYNGRLAEHFEGIALHSCGTVAHNITVQLRTPKLRQMDWVWNKRVGSVGRFGAAL